MPTEFEKFPNALQAAEDIFDVRWLYDARAGEELSKNISLEREKEWNDSKGKFSVIDTRE